MKTWIAAIGLGVIVVLVNIILIGAYRSRSARHEFEALSRVFQRVKNPWKDEEDQLKELSRRVADLVPPESELEERDHPQDHP